MVVITSIGADFTPVEPTTMPMIVFLTRKANSTGATPIYRNMSPNTSARWSKIRLLDVDLNCNLTTNFLLLFVFY